MADYTNYMYITCDDVLYIVLPCLQFTGKILLNINCQNMLTLPSLPNCFFFAAVEGLFMPVMSVKNNNEAYLYFQ